MMKTLRVGGADVLNIVYNDLRYYYGLANRLLGHALLPEFFSLYGDIDGVVISKKGIVYPDDPETYPYSVCDPYNLQILEFCTSASLLHVCCR